MLTINGRVGLWRTVYWNKQGGTVASFKPHAEGLMALAVLRSSHLWQRYWNSAKTDVA